MVSANIECSQRSFELIQPARRFHQDRQPTCTHAARTYQDRHGERKT